MGALTKKLGDSLNITLYFTALKCTLLDVKYLVLKASGLKIKTNPEKLPKISYKKQETVHFLIECISIPYELPQINLQYRIQD